MNHPQIFFRLGAFLAGTAVLLGAFGAHGLEGRLDPDLLHAFETGARYQFFHALALMILAQRRPDGGGIPGTVLLTAGTLVFAGSLYLLALTPWRFWGMVTPFGGLLLLAGWTRVVFTRI